MNFKSLLGLETVNDILSAFDTQRDKLHLLAGKLKDSAAKHEAQAEALLAKVDGKRDEAERALRVAAKISNLID